jgi:para-aminobenzoate synthetase component 1
VKALGSIAEVERELRAEGFFEGGAAGLVADLYIGYGLSSTLRRTPAPDPPEPCPLPPAAVRVRPAVEPPPAGGRYEVGDWERTWDEASYAAAVDGVREAIAAGDVYQVNLVQHLSAPFRGDPAGLASGLAPLRPLQPRPLLGDGWAVVSASPELFLARRGSRVWTKPIKGTLPLGADEELAESVKDAAEHVMIVDLERNDLSRVCEAGSVRWPRLMAEHELAGVRHLISTVEGTLKEEVGLAELLEATFPGGSVTGAPKISAIDHIAALEPVGRGASMGAVGRIYPNGDLDLALTIRTFAVAEGRIHLWVGGGIVWDSEADAEIEESLVKARPLLTAIGAPLPRGKRPVSPPRLLPSSAAGFAGVVRGRLHSGPSGAAPAMSVAAAQARRTEQSAP